MNTEKGWQKTSLDLVIADIQSGSRPRGGVSSDHGDIPSLGGENILSTGGIKANNTKLVSTGFFNHMAKGHLKDGDVLINKDGAQTGKVGYYDTEIYKLACINEHLFLLRGIPEQILQKFLYYTLLSQESQNQIRSRISGSAQPGLKSDFIKGVVIDLPESIKEQSIIVEVLSTVDQAIEQTEALITKQKRIKTGLMQDILTRGVDEHGNLRSEKTHKFKDSPLGRIPVEWDYKQIRERAEVCNNLRKPIASLVRETIKGIYPYYGPTGILDFINEYKVDGEYVLIGEDGDHFLKYKGQEMTLLIRGKFNVNNHAHILRGKGNVLTQWLHIFFLHRDITLYLTRQGAGRFKLNKASLLDLPVLVPNELKEQERIINVINSLRNSQILNQNTLNKLKSQKAALMQDLLSGKKRVTPLLDLPEVMDG